MEILQTIWTALTTENESMINIICSPLTFIEIYISLLLFSTILQINSTKKSRILYVILFSVFSLITIYFVPTPYNTFLNLIICPILVLIIFKTNILKAILAELIPYVFFILIGSLLLKLYINIFSITSNYDILNIPIHKILYSIFLYFIVFLIYKICNKFNLNIMIFDKLKKYVNYILICNFIIGIIAISIQSYLATLYFNNIPVVLSISNIVILFLYFGISMYSLFRTNKLEQTTQNLEEEKLYNKTLTILHDNIRGFKHDFNNTVQAIGGYITTNNMDGLKKYYNELLDDCQKVNNLSILNPEIINHPAIYSLLTSKYYSSDELGIKMNIEVLVDLNSIDMKIYEFSKILGILLDNAIEAAKTCTEKEIRLIIRNDDKQNRILVIVENTYSNKEVNVDKIFEKGYTSKKNEVGSHGLGLWEVRQILKRNNNLNLYTTKNNKYFKQQLEIYHK